MKLRHRILDCCSQEFYILTIRRTGRAEALLTTSTGSGGKCFCPFWPKLAQDEETSFETEHARALRRNGNGRSCAACRRCRQQRTRSVGRNRAPPGNFAALSRATVREIASQRFGRGHARTGRRLSPGSARGRNADCRHYRCGRRADQGDALSIRQLKRLSWPYRALSHA